MRMEIFDTMAQILIPWLQFENGNKPNVFFPKRGLEYMQYEKEKKSVVSRMDSTQYLASSHSTLKQTNEFRGNSTWIISSVHK